MAAKKIASKSRNPLQVGNAVFIRTVTGFFTGRIIELDDADIVLDDAAWVADTGRFSAAMATGLLNEVEPYPGIAVVSRGALVDACVWAHALPRKVK